MIIYTVFSYYIKIIMIIMDDKIMPEKENTDSFEDIEIKINIRFERKAGVIFGQGRYQLLTEIEKHGSLQQAAKKIGMSYRAAWGKIKNSEKILGEKLIEKETNKEGYNLTALGKMLKEKFHQYTVETEAFAREKFNKEFDFLLKNNFKIIYYTFLIDQLCSYL